MSGEDLAAKMGRDGDDWCMCCPARTRVIMIRTGIQETRICMDCWDNLTKKVDGLQKVDQ